MKEGFHVHPAELSQFKETVIQNFAAFLLSQRRLGVGYWTAHCPKSCVALYFFTEEINSSCRSAKGLKAFYFFWGGEI